MPAAGGGGADGGGGREPRRYTFAELSAATAGFAADRKLGAGGFGAVFRGELRSDVPAEDGGRAVVQVAVKRLGQDSGPGTAAGLPSAEQFAAEVRAAALRRLCRAAATLPCCRAAMPPRRHSAVLNPPLHVP